MEGCESAAAWPGLTEAFVFTRNMGREVNASIKHSVHLPARVLEHCSPQQFCTEPDQSKAWLPLVVYAAVYAVHTYHPSTCWNTTGNLFRCRVRSLLFRQREQTRLEVTEHKYCLHKNERVGIYPFNASV
jgi:hypothetical protein